MIFLHIRRENNFYADLFFRGCLLFSKRYINPGARTLPGKAAVRRRVGYFFPTHIYGEALIAAAG